MYILLEVNIKLIIYSFSQITLGVWDDTEEEKEEEKQEEEKKEKIIVLSIPLSTVHKQFPSAFQFRDNSARL